MGTLIHGKAGEKRMLYVLFFVFAAGLFAAIPLRTYSLALLVDPKTGFFRTPHPVIPIYYVVLVVCCVLFVALCLRRGSCTLSPRSESRFIGLSGMLSGLLLVVEGALSLVGSLPVLPEQWPALALGALEIVAGSAFGLGHFLLLNGYSRSRVAALLPIPLLVWGAAKLLIFVLTTLTLVQVSQNLLDLWWQCSLLLFLLAFSRGMFLGEPGNARLAAGFGLCTAFLSFAVYFSRVLSLLASDIPGLLALLPGDAARLTLGVFAYACAVAVIFSSSQPAIRRPSSQPEGGGYYYHARTGGEKRVERRLDDLFEDLGQ